MGHQHGEQVVEDEVRAEPSRRLGATNRLGEPDEHAPASLTKSVDSGNDEVNPSRTPG